MDPQWDLNDPHPRKAERLSGSGSQRSKSEGAVAARLHLRARRVGARGGKREGARVPLQKSKINQKSRSKIKNQTKWMNRVLTRSIQLREALHVGRCLNGET
jgi:hypothetical protein